MFDSLVKKCLAVIALVVSCAALNLPSSASAATNDNPYNDDPPNGPAAPGHEFVFLCKPSPNLGVEVDFPNQVQYSTGIPEGATGCVWADEPIGAQYFVKLIGTDSVFYSGIVPNQTLTINI